jgi:NADPH2 dehydrogenase
MALKHFHYKSLDEIAKHAAELTEYVRFETDAGKIKESLGRKVRINDALTLGNSMAIHPMEGCDGTLDGRPDELTIRRYHRFAAGGAKLLWFEATAVREEGRAARGQRGRVRAAAGADARDTPRAVRDDGRFD